MHEVKPETVVRTLDRKNSFSSIFHFPLHEAFRA